MPDMNGVEAAVAAAAIERKRSVTRDDYGDGGRVVNFMIPNFGSRQMAALPAELPEYSRYAFYTKRQSVLLKTPEYEAMWATAVHIAVTKTAARSWEIESAIPLRRKRVQLLVHNATGGVFTGWVPFISAHLSSYVLTGLGVVEIERETTAYSSRITALHHLNPLRCRLTDDPKIPVLYYDKSGRTHELNYWQCMVFGDMIDPTIGEYSYVQSAAERAYKTIRLLSVIEQFLYEKVAGKRPLALQFVQGLNSRTLEDAVASAELDANRKGIMSYMGAAVAAIQGDTPLSLVTVPLAELPDGFEAQELRDDAYVKYANALGIDVNDIDPRLAQSRNLGSGAQSIVLHEKSKGRGLATWQQQFEHNFNFWVADTSTTFRFSEESLDDEIKKAQLADTRTQTNSKRIADGVITADQARNLEVDAGDLPREFLVDDATAGTVLQDDEKPVERTEATQQATPSDEEAPEEVGEPVEEKAANGRVQWLVESEMDTAVQLAAAVVRETDDSSRESGEADEADN